MSRLILVSNRLPVTVQKEGKKFEITRSAGGLATGLSGPHEASGGKWIGWSGITGIPAAAARTELEAELAARRCVPVHLDATEISQYYEGYCNRVVWPLFHYLLETLPRQASDIAAYRDVNQKFADVVAQDYQQGDLIWVQDYQLMLLPGMLRDRLPDARIGFFLHIPFPASEIFRILPDREAVLHGLLGADLIGFHTLGYARHFASSLLSVLGIPTAIDQIRHRGRAIRLGAFPMGIDAETFSNTASAPTVEARLAEMAAMRNGAKDQRLLLGIDRLDYTKGIPRRLLAVERLLEDSPRFRGKVRLLQVAVPSRTKVDAYERLRREVDEQVGRINGRYGTVTSVPVNYLYQSFDNEDLCAMYRAADVMLVTPLRDGMNLVAKEFVASRVDGDGVLVLSEFAGAAAELGEAVQVNPYDVGAMARAIERALDMPEDERRVRMAALRGRVAEYDVHRWASTFIDTLRDMPVTAIGHMHPSSRAEVDAALAKLTTAEHVVLLLDYDGTLVNFVGLPELAVPGERVRALIKKLSTTRGVEVHIVSGRKRSQIEKWLGDLPIGLHAEHCYWSRLSASEEWEAAVDVVIDWKEKLRSVFARVTALVPGSFIEEKTASLAWHYRMADPEFAAHQANELYLHLTQTFSNAPVEILPGSKVVEVRPHNVAKSLVVRKVPALSRPGTVACALGDDRTDEDLFAALPGGSIALHVGANTSIAPLRLADVDSALRFLDNLASARS